MTTEQQTGVFAPPLGDQGRPCAECRAPLATDQRYCLNCGRRATDARLPFMEVLETRFRRANRSAPEQPAVQPPRRVAGSTVNWAAGAAFAAVLALGAVIGALLDDEPKQVAAAPPQVISVSAPAGAAAAAPGQVQFTADWPEGTDGFTIQLQTISSEGTAVADVDAAKTAAEGKGASDVGALDSDDYDSLDSGNYVIYSGVFKTRKQARKALGKLEKKFPDARVVEVSSGGGGASTKKEATVDRNQLEDLKKSTSKEQQEKSRKLPDTTKLPGKAPPKDEKKPGGGSGGGGEVIE